MVDAPVALVERVGQRRTRWRRLHSHVKQLGSVGSRAGQYWLCDRLTSNEADTTDLSISPIRNKKLGENTDSALECP
jgi:hypothetical protein